MADHHIVHRPLGRPGVSRWRRWLATASALATALIFLPALNAGAAGPAVLAVTVTVTDPGTGAAVSRVDASAMANYVVTVAYSCSVEDCQNATAVVDPTPLDPTYETFRKETAYTFSPPFVPAPVVTGSLATGFTVPLGTITAGSSGTFGFSYRINSRPSGPQPGSFFVDGSPITPKVTLTADNATGAAVGTGSAAWVSTVPAKPTLTLSNPTSTRTDTPVTVTVGGDSRCLTFNGGGTLIGAPWLTCAASYEIPVVLPANAQYVVGSGGTYDTASHTVTLSRSGLDAAGGVTYNQHAFQVTFPNDAYPTAGAGCVAAETFTATESMTYLDGTVRTADPATRAITAQNCLPFAKGTMSKRVGRADGGTADEPILKIPTTPGATRGGFYWQLIAGNQANVAGVATITDDELDQADLPVTAARVTSGGPATVDYTLDDGSTGSISIADNAMWTAPAGRQITAIAATSSPLAGPNQQPSGNLATNFRLDLMFSLSYGATPGSRTNTATATISYPDQPDLDTLALGPATVNPLLTVPTDVTLVAGGPAATTPSGGTPIVGSTVNWAMRGRFVNAAEGAGYVPQYIFLAPKDWTITPGTASVTGLSGADYSYRTVTYEDAIRDAVVVTWPGPVTEFANFTLPTLSVQAVPTAGAPAGTNNQIANLLVRTTDGSPITTYYPDPYTDVTDIDGNGDSSDVYAVEVGRASLAPSSSIGVIKEICRPDAAAADGCDWIANSGVLVGVPPNATSIKYRVRITNTGNSVLTNVVAYDVLPYPGDTGLTDGTVGTPRGSTVTEVLSEIGEVSPELTLAYSSSTNPARPEVYSGSTDPDDWGGEVTGAHALRAVAASLPANSSVSFVYQAALVGAEADALACNSVAAVATTLAVIQPAAVCATTQEADLSTTTADRYPLQRGRPGVMPFVVLNGGASQDAAGSVILSVPESVAIIDLEIAGWSCTAPALNGPVDIRCDPIDDEGNARPLARGVAETIALPVIPESDAPEELCFSSSIDGVMFDPDLTNNSVQACSGVRAADQPLLTVTKTDGVGSVPVGGTTTYTVTVANHLSGESIDGVEVKDILPEGVEFVSASDGGSFADDTVTWNLSALSPAEKPSANGDSVTGNPDAAHSVTVTVRIPAGSQDLINNHATVTADDPAGGDVLTDQARDIDTVMNVWTDGGASESTPHNTPIGTELDAIVTTSGAPVDPSSVTADTDPEHGSIAIDPPTGAVTYTPDAGYSGPDGYAVRVCDLSAPAPQCHVATVVVTVQPNTVTAADDVASTDAVTAVGIDVLTNDVSTSGQPLGDPQVTDAPEHGSAELTGSADQKALAAAGTITYTPAAGFSGIDRLTYRVCDTSVPTPVCDTASVTITVDNVWTDGEASVSTGQNTSVTTDLTTIVTTAGAPMDPASVAPDTDPEHGTIAIDPETGAVTYTPDVGYSGPDGYAVRVCDTTAPTPACQVASVAVTVQPNEVVAPDKAVTTPMGASTSPIDVLGDATSASGQPLANPAIATEPEHGSVAVGGDGTITYTPNEEYSGADEFTYTLCDTGDPLTACDTGTITVTVTPTAGTPTEAPPGATTTDRATATATATATEAATRTETGTTATRTATTTRTTVMSGDTPTSNTLAPRPVAPSPSDDLANTGVDVGSGLAAGLVVLVLGVGLLLLGRPRRRRTHLSTQP